MESIGGQRSPQLQEPGLWLSRHIERTMLGLLDAPWILDVDVTIKPLYGKQQGAVLGYNPHKPGRPSHAYHSDQVSGLRLMLAVGTSWWR